MNAKRVIDLDEMLLEDLEEQDSILIWDDSEQNTKRISFQTLVEFIQMLESK